MPLVTVRAHDARIEYYGTSWKDDLFEIRPDLDPSTGGGVNDTAGGVCVLGVGSRETWGFGNGFRLSFTGIAVRLVMQSRQDHGFYVVNLDGAESTISEYSEAPHCGSTFVADNLPLGKHTVSATLTGKSPASTWRDTYMQMFAIQYDPGESSSNSTGQTPQTSTASPAPTAPSVRPTQQAISAGAIAGVTIAGFVVAFGLVLLGAWLVRRGLRQRAFGGVPVYDASEKPLGMRRDKGRRPSVLREVPSAYMLHPGVPTSSMGAASSTRPNPGSTFATPPSHPSYTVGTDSFSGSSVSPYPMSPTAAPTSSLSAYSASAGAQSPTYQAAPLPIARANEKSGYMAPPPPENGGTMLPPYRSD